MAKDIIDHKDIDARSHPAARLFPMMIGPELSELAEDIRKNGQLEPISLYGDLILDGRNRAAARKMLGIAPMSVRVETSSPVQYVMAKNLHRRHLTIPQRAEIAVKMMPMLEEEARKRQGTRNDLVQDESLTTLAPSGANVNGKSAEIAAKAVGVSTRALERAKRVIREDPDAFEKVKRGEISLTAAEESIGKKKPAAGRSVKEPCTRQDLTPGEKKQPTARDIVRAKAHRERMAYSLGCVSGAVKGLTEYLDVTRVALACTPTELKEWVKDAKKSAEGLRKFAMKLAKEVPGTTDQIHEVEQRRDSDVATPKEDILRANAKEVPVGGGVDMPGNQDMPDADDSLPARYRAKVATIDKQIAARRAKGKEPTERMLESKAFYGGIVAKNAEIGF